MVLKSKKANDIVYGRERYSPRQWRDDLLKEMACEDEDEVTRKRHYELHLVTLYLAVSQLEFPKIKAAFLQCFPGFAESEDGRKIAAQLIKDIRKDYNEFEELLIALLLRKCLDFEAKGLPEKVAGDLACDWLTKEIL